MTVEYNRSIFPRRLTLLAVVLLATAWTVVDAGRITGRVTEAGTGDPLIGANVVIKGTSIGTATDEEGRYTLIGAPVGKQLLQFSYLGFETKEFEVDVIESEVIVQDAELSWKTVEGEEVEITAQASGQIAAINEQLASNTISNVVSKDRIQELPDVNAAESVGRLPGVSILRSNGEASKIAIRGLSPKYNTVTVNGVRVPSTGDSDRSVDMSLISSNMLDGIEVLKALTPDKDADAIGGSVDLKLRRAEELPSYDLQVQSGYNRLQDTYGNYKIAGSASRRFANGLFGLILNFSTDEYDRSADNFSANYQLVDKALDGELQPRVQTLNLNENVQTRSRDGGSFVFDLRLPKGSLLLNGFYNKLSTDQVVRGNSFGLETQLHEYTASDNFNETSISTFSASLEQDLKWLIIDLSAYRTGSDSNSPANYWWRFRETGAFDSEMLDRWGPPSDVPLAARNNLENTGLEGLSISSVQRNEAESGVQGNVVVPFAKRVPGFLGGAWTGYLKFGGKLRSMERENDQDNLSRGLYYGGDQYVRDAIAEALPGLGFESPEQYLTLPAFYDSTYVRENFLDGQYPLGFAFDLDAMREVTSVLLEGRSPESLLADADGTEHIYEYLLRSASGTLGRDYRGEERYQARYVMTELNVGKLFTLMPGVRWEKEKSTYHARFIRDTGNNQVPVYIDTTSTRESNFMLPMIHVRTKPVPWLSLRAAYTHSLTRPDYLQYAPITYVNPFNTWVRAGNPSLKPALSKNWDVSASVFQGKVGLLTFSAFKKSIQDLIWQTTFFLLEGQQILPDLEIPGTSGVPQVDTYSNNQFQADYTGFEVDWQTNLWYLPSFLSGIVISVNYAQIISETRYVQYRVEREPILPPRPPFFELSLADSSRAGRMPDQPSHIANVSLGYDYKGFSARVSFLYQSDTMTWLAPQKANDRFTEDYVRWDLSLKQELRNGLQMFANLNNLNNRADRNYQAALGLYPTSIQYYGFTMDVGARYRF